MDCDGRAIAVLRDAFSSFFRRKVWIDVGGGGVKGSFWASNVLKHHCAF